MARNVKIVLTDDIDGSEASQTVVFGLDGTNYEMDLSDANAAKLRDELAVWIGNARRVSGRRGAGRKVAAGPSDAAKIRAWAVENGHTVPERGRIPSEIRQAYEDANK